MAISQIPALTGHFIPNVRGHIGQTRCRQIYPLHQTAIFSYSCSDSSYFMHTLRVNIWQTRCMQIYPLPKWQFLIFLLWHLILDRPSVGRSTPPSNRNLTDSFSDRSYFVLTVRAHIGQTRCWQIYSLPKWQFLIFLLWQLILDRPSVGSSTAHRMAISQIPSLTGHISFLIWEVILGRPGVADLPPCRREFHRFLLWQVIFRSYCESSYWADQVLADLLPPKMAIFDIPTLTAYIRQTKCWQFYCA